MNKLVFIGVSILSAVAVAETAPSGADDAAKAAKLAETRQKVLEKTGGIIDVAPVGEIAFVNCQGKIPMSEVKSSVDQLNKVLRMNVKCLEGSWKMGTAIPKGASVALFIVDDQTLPMSLIAPESQWGVLNVSKIDSGKRFEKAFVRAAILTLGAGVSSFKGSPMQTVRCPEDLDKVLSNGISYDAITSIMANLTNLGVTRARKTTYRKACQEGWAAAPTNDYQKVVWEEVHAKPTNPMKIKYDPKKGE